MRNPQTELHELAQDDLLRQLRILSLTGSPTLVKCEGRRLINFSSNDYLGLSRHPSLQRAGTKALEQFGTGATASRLVCGTMEIHRCLEEQIAQLKQTEEALVFSNGYSTALGTLTALLGPGDTVILDKLSHASLIDGARLSGATIRVFPHNNLNRLEAILQSVRRKSDAKARVLVVTESVFSMDGDRCPLRELVELKNRYGALLLLDEAHALGVLGPSGLGLVEELGLQAEVELQMGTLGKAAGAAGGYLAGSKAFIELLVNKARSFIYSTAPPPAQIAAAAAALKLITSETGRDLRDRLASHRNKLSALLRESSWEIPPSGTPIIPLIMGDNERTLNASNTLQGDGFLVPAIRYPTVPRGTARLRLTLSAAHEERQIEHLADALKSLDKKD
ncbi:MAG: 8-amino-7-oxononanoate synthase [Verrucomicrobiota bacterium JB023]|nr:8-amino-7-oxononanoate synthase [Verrucomicrobiota bacterium JB023]